MALMLLLSPPQPFDNIHCPVLSSLPSKLLSPLQGPPAPTTQIPICLSVFSFAFGSIALFPSLLLLLPILPEVESEDDCAFIIIVVDTDNERKLIPSIKNKNTKIELLFLFILLLICNHHFL